MKIVTCFLSRCTTTKGTPTLLLETLGVTVSTRCWDISLLLVFSGKVLSFATSDYVLLMPVFSILNIFCMFRLHSLLGDFYQAIKVLENIELNKKSLYSRVPGCQITTYYYVGFAYMMMRRYADAIRTFSNILLYVQRTKTMFAVKSYQNDQINKQTDLMQLLLQIG